MKVFIEITELFLNIVINFNYNELYNIHNDK